MKRGTVETDQDLQGEAEGSELAGLILLPSRWALGL